MTVQPGDTAVGDTLWGTPAIQFSQLELLCPKEELLGRSSGEMLRAKLEKICSEHATHAKPLRPFCHPIADGVFGPRPRLAETPDNLESFDLLEGCGSQLLLMGPLGLGHQLLVLNAGSSSLKYAVFTAAQSALKRVVHGIAEGIGTSTQACFKHQNGAVETTKDVDLPDHRKALTLILEALGPTDGIVAVGHRVVHGGEKFSEATLVDDEVLREISAASSLAPMHNPWNVLGIEVSREIIGQPQVAVFDTAFHQTMPPHAYLYGIPYALYTNHSIRKYGFHGTSYRYILGEAAKALGKAIDQTSLIVCHLGSGASMCAIREGKCIDTTMGLTPLEGLMMGSRSGDLDPAVPLHLINQLGYTAPEVAELLNKKSGLLGVSGFADNRDVEAGYRKQEPLAILAKQLQVYRTRKYLGAYLVALEGCVDALVFTGGVGENSHLHRRLVCDGLGKLGIELDESRNQLQGGRFSSNMRLDTGKAMQIWVIPTDEELSIARQTAGVLACTK